MANMKIDQKNVSKLFADMQGRKFIIPDYQRPYKWENEECETLWDDLRENFTSAPEKDYFMGTIVNCGNDDNDLEIIDGQQRLTTFSLLLRAFYTKLESMTNSPEVCGLKSSIEPCLWDLNRVTKIVQDKTRIRINSLVATHSNNTTFHNILITGNMVEDGKDNYSKNYKFFMEKCAKCAMENPITWYDFCVFILEKCVLLPIECKDNDVALKIFSTLNNRGMSLSDADIFKSELYKIAADKALFIEKWKRLDEICESTRNRKGNYDFTIDDMFTYYMQVLRGRAGDKDTSIVGLRAFYLERQKNNLLQKTDLDEIIELAEFWKSAVGVKGNKKYEIGDEGMKWLHCLWTYPNDIWVYPLSSYFLTNRDLSNLALFLKRLTAYLYAKFIYTPSRSSLKYQIFQMDIDICNKTENPIPLTDFIDDTVEYELDKFNKIMIKKFVRGLLTIDAYLNPRQLSLIENPDKLEIEHILPKKWTVANYKGWDKTNADEYLEKFGNKVLIEKKLNIQAGPGYFGQKKKYYKKSELENVKDLSDLEPDDWSQGELEQRDKDFKMRIIGFLKKQDL